MLFTRRSLPSHTLPGRRAYRGGCGGGDNSPTSLMILRELPYPQTQKLLPLTPTPPLPLPPPPRPPSAPPQHTLRSASASRASAATRRAPPPPCPRGLFALLASRVAPVGVCVEGGPGSRADAHHTEHVAHWGIPARSAVACPERQQLRRRAAAAAAVVEATVSPIGHARFCKEIAQAG